ncbi:bifunctional diguanylate cyclase/phosphodiesterase [Corallincola platygyrae]|uniref:Bifunctional diguanylate cyclase/phosphodiesterase n=1 Tax=Corallincola platygyrae TaxID=1193278 RepID=A0ABW4XR50_9GAMM
MNSQKLRALKKRTSVLYGIMLAMALLLSVAAIHTVSSINRDTNALVSNSIPELEKLGYFRAAIKEMEQQLYQLYATSDNDYYVDFERLQIETDDFVMKQNVGNDMYVLDLSLLKQHAIELNQNMQHASTDWDLARAQLAMISEDVAVLQERAQQLMKQRSADINNTIMHVQDDLGLARIWAVVFAIGIAVIAAFSGRLVFGFLSAASKNERLAKYPKRNPNPVLTVTEDNEIVFSNAACYQLLEQAGLAPENLNALLPEKLDHYKQQILNDYGLRSQRFEYRLNQKHLLCSIGYVDQQKQFDLHISDISELKTAQEELEFLAHNDARTQLPNLYCLTGRLEQQFEQMPEQPVGLAVFEIQRFNQLVSGYGHEQVNTILLQMSKRLRSLLDEIRFDGEIELYRISSRAFALKIWPFSSPTELAEVAQQLMTRAADPLDTDFGEFQLELEMGISHFPALATDASNLILQATTALDEATVSNQTIVHYHPDMLDHRQQRLTMEAQLRKAIANYELRLYFQPQMDIATGKIIGAEALLRWQHGENMVSPVEFIPVAEQSGLIIEIGEWIIEQACRVAKNLLDAGQAIPIAINISARQFQHPELYQQIERALQRHQLPAELIELEITESVAMHQQDEVLAVLNRFKALGVGLSIDDFGTGYSSLAYLRQFPVNKLKIDRSFIVEMLEQSEDEALVNTIIGISHHLQMKVVAEGVETEPQLARLKEMGCDTLQGYLYSRPLPESDFNQFVKATTAS